MLINNPYSLESRNIVITGASSGIGAACAIKCAESGARVALIGRDDNRLKEVQSRIIGRNSISVLGDVTKFEKIEDLVAEVCNEFGEIHGFIHSAGLESTLPLRASSIETYQSLLDVNTLSAIKFSQILTKKRYAAGQQSFVYITSTMGIVGNKALSAYSASKGALIAATRSLAIEFAEKGKRFNSVSPGHIRGTKMSDAKESKLSPEAIINIEKSHPLGIGDVNDVAYACIYLLSNASKWVTGTNLLVDGGYTAK